MSSLPKPVLRGHCARFGRRALFMSITIGAITSGTIYYNTCIKRRHAYEEWVKTYDPEEHYKELVKYGYIWSPDKKDDS